MLTTIGISRATKEQLEDVRRRHNIKSYHETVRFLINIEKKQELDKLTNNLTEETLREILDEYVRKVE